MKTRIIARYLTEYGINEIGDRDIDLDQYKEESVQSVEEGVILIRENDPDGIGTVSEEIHREEYDTWETMREHRVDSGHLYESIML